MANVANKVAAKAVEANKPVEVNRANWFDAGKISVSITKVTNDREAANKASVDNFIDALGNALIHGNGNLLNKAIAALTGSELLNGKRITHTAIARKILTEMNATLLPSNKIAGGIKADIFAFSKDGVTIKNERMRGRNHFATANTESEMVKSLNLAWTNAGAMLAMKERDEKVAISIDAIPAKLDRLVKAIGEEFELDDFFAIEALKELKLLAKEIKERAEAAKLARAK